MKIGTPEASKARRPAGSQRTFHSADGGSCLISGRFVVVSPTDAAAHHHNALQFAESGWVARNRRLLVEKRTDGDEGDLPGMRANLAEQKANRVTMLAIGLLARIRGLGEAISRLRGDACLDRKVFPAHCREVTIDEARAQFGIAEGRGDAEEFHFRAAQQKCQRKRIVDVVANVGVDNDELLDFGSRTRLCCLLPVRQYDMCTQSTRRLQSRRTRP